MALSKNGEVKPGKKIIFSPSGNASKSISCRISLPKSWVEEMGVTKEDFVKASFIDGKIIIEKQ